MKRTGRVVIVVVIAIAAIVAYAIYRRAEERRPLQWPGTVEAHTIDVGSRVGGRVRAVNAREGDVVAEGQVLVLLEAGDLFAQRAQAQGQLAQAESALERVSTGKMNARNAEIAAADARLAGQRVALQRAQLDRDRMTELFVRGGATRAERDNAELTLRNAQSALQAQEAERAQLVRGTSSDVRGAQGQLEAANARIEQVNNAIDELTIRAPRQARIESLDLRPGDLLPPSAIAARLLEPGQLYVRVYVPETQLGFVRPGMQVPVFVDSFPHQSFPGVVEFVSDVGEFTPRNLQTADERADEVFATRVRVDDPRGVLRVGMAATVEVRR